MNREEIFGRLIALATVLGDRVFDKGVPSVASQYLDKIARNPAETITRIHEQLMQYAHKFGPEELALLDLFGEQMAALNLEDFNNQPLSKEYIIYYYQQKAMNFVGVTEAAEILGWSKQQVSVYIQRERFPEPVQRLASGPIWTEKQIYDFRESRKS